MENSGENRDENTGAEYGGNRDVRKALPAALKKAADFCRQNGLRCAADLDTAAELTETAFGNSGLISAVPGVIFGTPEKGFGCTSDVRTEYGAEITDRQKDCAERAAELLGKAADCFLTETGEDCPEKLTVLAAEAAAACLAGKTEPADGGKVYRGTPWNIPVRYTLRRHTHECRPAAVPEKNGDMCVKIGAVLAKLCPYGVPDTDAEQALALAFAGAEQRLSAQDAGGYGRTLRYCGVSYPETAKHCRIVYHEKAGGKKNRTKKYFAAACRGKRYLRIRPECMQTSGTTKAAVCPRAAYTSLRDSQTGVRCTVTPFVLSAVLDYTEKTYGNGEVSVRCAQFPECTGNGSTEEEALEALKKAALPELRKSVRQRMDQILGTCRYRWMFTELTAEAPDGSLTETDILSPDGAYSVAAKH